MKCNSKDLKKQLMPKSYKTLNVLWHANNCCKDSHVGTPVCMDFARANIVGFSIADCDAVSGFFWTAENCKSNCCWATVARNNHLHWPQRKPSTQKVHHFRLDDIWPKVAKEHLQLI